MSGTIQDLAPFVAAVLRDGVVAEQTKEFQDIRESYQRVELTGPSGDPVYASFAFDQGKYQGLGHEWAFDSVLEESRVVLSMEQCHRLEIRLGGMIRAVWHQNCAEGFLQSAVYNKEQGMTKNVAFCFGPTCGISATCDVQMDEVLFEELTRQDEYGGPIVDSESVPTKIFNTCPKQNLIQLRSIAFFTDKIEGAMKAWKIPPYQKETDV